VDRVGELVNKLGKQWEAGGGGGQSWGAGEYAREAWGRNGEAGGGGGQS